MKLNVSLLTKMCRVEICRQYWTVIVNKLLKTDQMKHQVRWKTCNRAPDLNLKTMNSAIIKLQYAVRGPLLMRADAIDAELKMGKSNKPFKQIIRANLGDAHAMGQKPITFIRQVLAAVSDPTLIQSAGYPNDVRDRAECLLTHLRKSVGCYSASNGVEFIRRDVANFISLRDGYPCDWNNVVLVAGASAGIKFVLSLFKNNPSKKSGIMIPIPQYPLYTASLTEYGLHAVNYYLDEGNNWGLDVSELERALEEGSKDSIVRAIVVINPGNPTGQVQSKQNIEDVLRFAQKYNLFVFADEVYQDNVYAEGSKFWSFKKISMAMGEPYSKIGLASFMSMSKGFFGECGLRAGFMELCNIDKDVQAHLYKMISSNLCSSTLGQCVVSCYARPPVDGDESYEVFLREKTSLLDHLAQRAKLIYEAFNKMDGFKCNVVQGAMYAFPSFEMPQKAIDAARNEGKNPDVFYAFKLLESTGICVVAGSGFGQKKGTYHFRTTILPQTDDLIEMLKIFADFHKQFTKEYS